jgi:hypothetical protein
MISDKEVLWLRIDASLGMSDEELSEKYNVGIGVVRDCRLKRCYQKAGGQITKRNVWFPNGVIVQIRILASDNTVTLKSIAKQFNMSHGYVSRVVRGLFRKTAGGPISAARNEYFGHKYETLTEREKDAII